MRHLKSALIIVILFAGNAQAAGIPIIGPPDFAKWAKKTLQDKGITDARVVETQYPFNFTFCRSSSMTLWRYDVMVPEHIAAVSAGKAVKPVTEAERTVALESNSESCKG